MSYDNAPRLAKRNAISVLRHNKSAF
jgi:thiol-disulfide isomerase/thioredoxin